MNRHIAKGTFGKNTRLRTSHEDSLGRCSELEGQSLREVRAKSIYTGSGGASNGRYAGCVTSVADAQAGCHSASGWCKVTKKPVLS